MAYNHVDHVTARFPELQPVFAVVSRLTRDSGRYAFHAYLREVYRVVWHWSRKRIRKRQTKRLARIAQTGTRPNTHSFRVIIEATLSSTEAKMASRWTRALEYALSEQTPVSELDNYFRSSGGVAACARRAATEIPRRETYRKTWD